LSRFGLAWRPNPLLPVRRLRTTGLAPGQPRPDRRAERQRLRALALIEAERAHICRVAERYGVAPEALAGALLWDPLENPYRRNILRLGPGRVHPREMFRPSTAEQVEARGLVSVPTSSTLQRMRRLRQPRWAIAYVAAILRMHADNYRRIARVDVTRDPAVLCTLYQGGKSETRARRFVARRRLDPGARPAPADEMGPWVQREADFIRRLLGLEANTDGRPG
jgi:hypothetical protein